MASQKYKSKVFTEESITKLKKEIKDGFSLNINHNGSSIWVRTKDNRITLYKEIDFFTEEKVKDCEINWSAIGSVTFETAKKFNENFSEILRLAEFIEKEFETEIKEFEYHNQKGVELK